MNWYRRYARSGPILASPRCRSSNWIYCSGNGLGRGEAKGKRSLSIPAHPWPRATIPFYVICTWSPRKPPSPPDSPQHTGAKSCHRLLPCIWWGVCKDLTRAGWKNRRASCSEKIKTSGEKVLNYQGRCFVPLGTRHPCCMSRCHVPMSSLRPTLATKKGTEIWRSIYSLLLMGFL